MPTNIEKTEKGLLVQELENGEKRTYVAVRGGISWPLVPQKLPAYFCIYGEEWREGTRFEGQEKRGRLCFLYEYEAPDTIPMLLTSFFTKIVAAATRYRCRTFYTVTEVSRGEDYREYAAQFRSFVYAKRADVHLQEAPWNEKPDLGIHRIWEWKEKALLEIPEGSLIRAQLQTLQAEELMALPETLNAVNALRFVVYGFEEYKPPKPGRENWRSRVKTGSSWLTGGGSRAAHEADTRTRDKR
ncbi:MAG: hypothetical protein ABSD38_29270 [Syntrophorhabdales bacterium]